MRTIECPVQGLQLQLQRVEAFEGLDEATLELLARTCALQEFSKQEVLIEEGAKAEYFFVLLSGQVKLVHRAGSGREHLIHVVGTGAPVGLSGMFRQHLHPATAVALDTCLVLRLTREAITSAVLQDSGLALRLLGIMSLRVRMFVKKLSNQGVSSSKRVARYIHHRMLIEKSEKITLKVSREEMANMLGIARETLSRVMARFVHDGILAVQGRNVEILRPERLRALASQDRDEE